jgi:hypothetical protein
MNCVAVGLIVFTSLVVPVPRPAATPVKPVPSADAAALAARIDRMLEEAWAAKGITPAAPATDAEFLRRVYLDLAGRIPTVAEARAFLADPRPDRRRHLVAGLLRRQVHARHMATVWRHLLLPEADSNIGTRLLVPGFETWLRGHFETNKPYDELVRGLIAAPIAKRTGGFDFMTVGDASPVAFYIGKDAKPENLAAATARVFLGVRLECAQCHDHPFGEWRRDQFWGLAAFYAGIKGQSQNDLFTVPESETADTREVTIPGTERVVKAAYPDGTEPEWKFKSLGSRTTLAAWVTRPDNPYFARATANRVWAMVFGVGLVEPVDEMAGGQDVTAHHAGVLDALAKGFAGHKYDLRFLLETIVSTRAYQLAGTGKGGPVFSRHPLRGLTGEQLYDSLAAATGLPDAGPEDPFARFTGGSPRDEFLARFPVQPGRPVDYETSIIQALTLMNGKLVGEATSPSRSELLVGVLEAPFFDDAGRIETLYLAALSREPTARERERALAFVNRAAVGNDADRRREALADVFWALLNSAEFVFNH